MPLLEYESGKTWFHQMSPTAKFTWGMIVLAWVFTMFNPTYVLIIGVVIFILAKLGAHLSITRMLRTSLIVGVGSIFILFFQSFFYPGETYIFQIGKIHPTVEGLKIGLAIALRLLTIVTTSTVVAKTTDPRDVFLTLVNAGLPYKFAHGLFAALRFIPLLEYEATTIKEAHLVRGIVPQGEGVRSLIEQIRHFLVPFIATAIRRSQHSAIALEVRCFGLTPQRTYLRTLNFSKRGWLFVLVWFAAFVAYIVLTQGNLTGIVDTNPLAPG